MKITLPAPNGQTVKKAAVSLIVSLYHRKKKEMRKTKREQHKEGEKNVGTSAALDSELERDRNEMPLYRDVNLKWSMTDEQLWLGAADGEHIYTQGNDES